jgi:hypothetical protein
MLDNCGTGFVNAEQTIWRTLYLLHLLTKNVEEVATFSGVNPLIRAQDIGWGFVNDIVRCLWKNPRSHFLPAFPFSLENCCGILFVIASRKAILLMSFVVTPKNLSLYEEPIIQ